MGGANGTDFNHGHGPLIQEEYARRAQGEGLGGLTRVLKGSLPVSFDTEF